MEFVSTLFARAKDFIAILAHLGAEGFEVVSEVIRLIGCCEAGA